MWETLFQILQWAIPSGGFGAAIVWLVNRKARAAGVAKEVHDTYKTMYEDISRLLLSTQEKYERLQEAMDEVRDENANLCRSVNRLERAISQVKKCRYYAACPVRNELRDGQEGVAGIGGGEPRGSLAVGQRKRTDRKKKDGGGGSPIRGDPAD